MTRHRLPAAVAVGALLAVPAAPAQALPYCGGTWANYARCGFEAPAGSFAVTGVAYADGEGEQQAEVSVRVFVEIAGIQYTRRELHEARPEPGALRHLRGHGLRRLDAPV